MLQQLVFVVERLIVLVMMYTQLSTLGSSGCYMAVTFGSCKLLQQAAPCTLHTRHFDRIKVFVVVCGSYHTSTTVMYNLNLYVV